MIAIDHTGSLAGDDGQFPCPICRRDVVVPNQGFPVCLLSEYLREKVNIASKNAQGITSKCWSCEVKSVEARCRNYLNFICYRCATRGTCEKTSDKKHDSDDLEEISAVASSNLDGWKAKTKREIAALEEVVRQQQREIDTKKKILEACENIDKQSDSAQKIILIEQICEIQIVSSSVGELPQNPKGLRFISLHPTDHQCMTVCHIGDDKLALGCNVGLKIFNKTTAEMDYIGRQIWTSVTEYDGKIFLVYKKKGERIMACYNEAGVEDICVVPVRPEHSCCITVNKKFIAAADRSDGNIKLYNRKTKAIHSKNLPGLSTGSNLKFSPDGSLLVTGPEESVTNYRIPENPEEELVRVWTVKLETQVVGIDVTETGTIFAAGLDSKQIYMLSNKGSRLGTLKHDQLPGHCEGIGIRGDELAVAGFGDENVLLFKIF